MGVRIFLAFHATKFQALLSLVTVGVLPLTPGVHVTPARCVDLPTVHGYVVGSLLVWCAALPWCGLVLDVSVVCGLQNPCRVRPSRPSRATAAHPLGSLRPSTSGLGALLPVWCFPVVLLDRCTAASGWRLQIRQAYVCRGDSPDLRGCARRPSLPALRLVAALPIGACDVLTGAPVFGCPVVFSLRGRCLSS